MSRAESPVHKNHSASSRTRDLLRALRRSVAATLLLAGLSTTGHAALVNGGFETPVLAAGAYVTNPTGAGWTFGANSGIARNGSAPTAYAPVAPEGSQQGWVRQNGSILQSVALNPGDALSLKATQGANCQLNFLGLCLISLGSEPLGVFVNGSQVGASFTPPTGSWSTYTFPLGITTAGARTVEIRGLNAATATMALVDAAAVVSAPVVTISQPANKLGMALNTRVYLAAGITDPNAGASVSKVSYYDGTALLGTVTAAPYALTWTATGGTHNITAVATDSLGATGTSAPVTLTVFSTVPAPATATACASENGTCVIPAGTTATVWFGAAAGVSYRNDASGSVACNNNTFGDPNYGVAKSCTYQAQVAALPAGAASCAAQNATCAIPAGTTATVWYGASGHFFARNGVSGSIACSDSTFGDPLVGSAKACYTLPATIAKSTGDAQSGYAGQALPTPLAVLVRDGSGNPLANVPVSFSVTTSATATVLYGANNQYLARGGLAGSIACSNTYFGLDPDVGTVKNCGYVFSAGGVTGGTTACAALNGTCVLPAGATATVYFGSGSAYLVRSGMTGSFACAKASFGGVDPAPGTAETCSYKVTTAAANAGTTACASENGTCAIPATPTAAVSPASATTSASGIASATLTFGNYAGTTSVVATASVGSVTFTETSAAAPAIAKSSGDGQSGVVGKPLASPLVVLVKDGVGQPLAGATVSFAVTAGGGALSVGVATTNAQGLASTSLTLGPAIGTNTVRATGAGGFVDFTETGTASGKLAIASPNGGSGSINTPMTYTVQLQDPTGNAVTTSGVTVTFGVTGGTAMFVPDTVVTTTGGTASVTMVPTSAGSYSVTASSVGLTPAASGVTVSAPPTETIFTTQSPATPNQNDGVTYELGTKFTAAQAGRIMAVRYWKAPGESGTHVGTIWSAAGAVLAQVTFANETAAGWQQQSLPIPLAIAANTTYVVSTNVNAAYVATSGGLATSVANADLATVADNANGVYATPSGGFPTTSFNNSNYFRDVVFVPGPAPVSSVLVPLSGDRQSAAPSTGLPVPLTVQLRDSSGHPIVGTTVSLTARDGAGTVTSASVITDVNGEASTRAALGAAAGIDRFHASVTGVGSVDFVANADASGARALSISPQTAATETSSAVAFVATVLDAAGYVVTGATAPVTFSATGVPGSFASATVLPVAGNAYTTFRPTAPGTATIGASATGLTAAGTTLTVSGALAPETVFTTQIPTNPNATDNVAYELGMKFQSARPGQITGIDYYKAASETGSHVGNIWSANGTLLASVAFSGETASGWQRQALATPLAIAANTTYVVSVNANAYYAVTPSGLAGAIDNGDLASVADGLNGIYGASGSFPATSFNSANYFRDVNFLPDAVPVLSKASGDLQPGTPGAPLAQPLVVQVVGADGLPQSGVTVNFAVTAGGGSVSPAIAVTDVAGLARTSLTMGPATGRNAVTATTAAAGSVTFSAVVPNAVYLENLNPGTPGAVSSILQRYTSTGIAGYADAWSVNKGAALPLRVNVPAAAGYSVAVYRLGWYGGAGARLISSSGALTGVAQPPCVITDPTTHLVECQWSVTYTVQTASSWTSGLYVAALTNSATGQVHPVFFIVRDDAGTSDILFQSSRTTAYAYGSYGTPTAGYSLYGYNSTGGIAAQKVSLDRPSSELGEYSNLFNFEYPMARWLESQGYDVSYTTNMDLHTGGAAVLKPHKLFLSVGHDEYWSKEMRDAAEGGRDAGVNLGFFSGNSSYWRVRFEPSSTGVPNRVMVCYKDSINTPDPTGIPTYTWRDPLNNRPENAMMGVQYIGDNSVLYAGFDFVVADAADPLFANTGVVNGSAFTKLVGYEWDAVENNGFSPSGLVTLAASPVTAATVAPGEQAGANGQQTSNATYYTATSGATVFALGSIQFMWGLDSFGVTPPRVDPRAQQFAVNLLSKGGARPLVPSTGIVVP